VILAAAAPAGAENVAPSVHWGALAFPDQQPTLQAGVTFNRFTEFNRQGQRFNGIQESAGFNFATVTWSERLPRLDGWIANLTMGGGPTGPDPSEYLQNKFIHRLLTIQPVPVGTKRGGADFMVNGSLTKWFPLLGGRDTAFAGVAFATGSLYHEAIAQAGLRRFSLEDVAESWRGSAPASIEWLSRYVRFSLMGRYSRIYESGYHEVAPQSYLGQATISLARYGNSTDVPDWELEIGYSIDSGLFVNTLGNSIEKRFGTVAIRFPYGVFEYWNDALGRTDIGPTGGGRLMLDVAKIWERVRPR